MADEFESLRQVERLWKQPVHRALADLAGAAVAKTRVIELDAMQRTVEELMEQIGGNKQ